jgi:hypothetical protein
VTILATTCVGHSLRSSSRDTVIRYLKNPNCLFKKIQWATQFAINGQLWKGLIKIKYLPKV